MTALQHVRALHRRAIAVGGQHVRCDNERVAPPIDLVAAAIGGLADLTAAALIGVDLVDRALPREALTKARSQAHGGACQTLRLCHRALEADARNVGYDSAPWVDAAIHDSVCALEHDPEPGGTLHHADALARALAAAARGLMGDRMAVPGALRDAQTHALMLAVAAGV